jgi:hypothetical protein
MELDSLHCSGSYNSKVALRFLDNFRTPDQRSTLYEKHPINKIRYKQNVTNKHQRISILHKIRYITK